MSDAVATISKESWDKDVLQSQDVIMVAISGQFGAVRAR